MDARLQKRGSPPVRINVLKPAPSQGSQSGSANLIDGEADDEFAEKAKEITRLIRERFRIEGLSLPSESAGCIGKGISRNVVGSASEGGEPTALSQAKNQLAERLKMALRMSEDVGPVGEGSTAEETVANSSGEPGLENVNPSVGLNGDADFLKDSKPEELQNEELQDGSSSGHMVPIDSLITRILQHHAMAEDSDGSSDPSPGSSDILEAKFFLGNVEENLIEEMRSLLVAGSKLRGQGVCHVLEYEGEDDFEWSEAILDICMELQESMLDDIVAEFVCTYRR